MRCKNCKRDFSADWRQPSPGGSSAPGIFFWLAFALSGAGIGLLFANDPGSSYRTWGWVLVGVSAVTFLQTFVAWVDCSGGGECPDCHAKNKVRPWSL